LRDEKTEEANERIENLMELVSAAREYETRDVEASLGGFVDRLSLLSEADEESGTREARVWLMTMHAAKGLEFEHVYVLGLMAARMPGPRQRTLEPIPDALLKETLPPDTKAAHGEAMRRLLHVAMSRARARLVLAYPERTDRGSMQHPSPYAEEARLAVGGAWEQRDEELFGPAETLQSTFRLLRDELLTTVSQVGGRLGELRFDTDLDVSHAVVRYLELLKLAALLQRPAGQEVAEALADVNARLLAATTPTQREILQTSTLDQTLAGDGEQAMIGKRDEHSLGPFLPRKGVGLALSASDIQTYRSCPLRYKFARVLRIPTEQTLHQRFGIAVHTVLERFHCDGGETLAQLLELLDSGWRKAGLGDSQRENELRQLAMTALTRYHARLHGQESEPVWFERSFSFRLGPHHLRGRVDRVDRVTGEGGEKTYELIDYKTSRAKTAEQLKDDVQLSLYALAARDAWQLESARGAYYYVLDDVKVPVPAATRGADRVRDVVLAVADGILAEAFEPRPSPALCAGCEHRIVCPAAAA
jgi:DNA helicase-2/ATP-dependent DNA helicase PcrA